MLNNIKDIYSCLSLKKAYNWTISKNQDGIPLKNKHLYN